MTIIREVQRALVALRLGRELGVQLHECREALASVSERADLALARDDFGELPRSVLAVLSGVAAQPADDAERALDDALAGAHVPTPGASQQLEFIEDAIPRALARAAAIEALEDARADLDRVGRLLGAALRIAARDRVPLSRRLTDLVRDFDHADEPGVVTELHAELRAGTYRPWVARARLRWLPPEEGGRASLPSGPRYGTAARLEAVADLWPQEAWSVVVTFDPGAAPAREMEVGVELLVPERAPPGALAPGTWFELYEGARRVAVGKQLTDTP